MTFLAAPIWSQIAREQELETQAARIAFRFDAEQLAEQDDEWMKAEKSAGTPGKVARCLPLCLPLLLETKAMQAFRDQHPNLSGAIPEILDAADAVNLMRAEYRLNDQDATTLGKILSSPQAAEARWHAVARRLQGRSKAAAQTAG